MPDPMQGFPPPADAQVTLANWRNAHWNRWAFHHVRELLPTAELALNTMLISEGIYLSNELGREVTADEIKSHSKSTAVTL